MLFSLFRRRIFREPKFNSLLNKDVKLSNFEFTIESTSMNVFGNVILNRDINEQINRNNITYVSLDSSFTVIGKEVFNDCPTLVDVSLPDSILSIGPNSFSNCPALSRVSSPSSLYRIGEGAFQNINISTFLIQNKVDEIGDCAFHGCYNLKNLIVNSRNKHFTTVESVLYSKNMQKLIYFPHGVSCPLFNVPKGVATICSFAFSGTRMLSDVSLPRSVTKIEEFGFKDSSISHINIDTDVAAFAFEDCHSLASFEIGPRLHIIRKFTFSNCDNLVSVHIPKTVSIILDFAFNGCERMSSLVIEEGVKSLEYSCFHACNSLTNVVIPESVVNYNSAIFMDCASLQTVKIPFGTVPDLMFFNCRSLVSIDLANIRRICADSFKLCTNLSSIEFGNSLEFIGREAFSLCSSLTKVSLPKSLKTLNGFAFFGCSSIKMFEVDYRNTHFKAVNGVLYSKDSTRLIQYPAGRENIKFSTPESVVEVYAGAFGYAQFLEEVILRENVIKLGNASFSWSKSLKLIHYCGCTKQSGQFFYNTNNVTVLVPETYESVDFGELSPQRIKGLCKADEEEPEKESSAYNNITVSSVGFNDQVPYMDASLL